MKLWDKGYKVDNLISEFTVGNDYIFDYEIIEYDCIASIAHAKMLGKIEILKQNEVNRLIKGLEEIIKLHKEGKFKINKEDEDCHTAIEKFLTDKYGEVGKKIHTARSRNDQVLTALRLFEKDNLNSIKKYLNDFILKLKIVVKKFGKITLPGYTHMRKAMPTMIENYFGCFIESTEDNLIILNSVYKIIDKSPLGTAAGFGVPEIEIDRKLTSDLMGFNSLIKNPHYAQMSRGKFEAMVIDLLSQIMFDLNKLSSDLILFSMDEFGFIDLPKEFCTGSSIMPQKYNPDPLEIIRGYYHFLLGESVKVKSLIGNLISGYHRDLQLTKEAIIKSFKITIDSILVMNLILSKLKINKDKCSIALTEELFATAELNKLVKQGVPFREAYKIVSEKFKK